MAENSPVINLIMFIKHLYYENDVITAVTNAFVNDLTITYSLILLIYGDKISLTQVLLMTNRRQDLSFFDVVRHAISISVYRLTAVFFICKYHKSDSNIPNIWISTIKTKQDHSNKKKLNFYITL